MTSPALKARGGRQGTWTRETIIKALRRYAALYGDDFTAAAFSPSTAKWRDNGEEIIDRYYEGDPETGAAWPSLNAIKTHAPGASFNAARELAGLLPNKPGSKKRAPGEHRPVRDVSHAKATRVIYVEKADADVGQLRRDLARAERRAARAEAKASATERRPRPAKPVTKVVRERVVDERAVARLETRVARAQEETSSAKAAEREARSYATRAASKVERVEAKLEELRAETREAVTRAARAEDAEAAALREVAAARAEIAERRVIVKEAPEQEIIDEAVAVADRARGVAHAAELRAARAEREYLEIAAAATGEPRRLARAEVEDLRSSGPAGQVVLAGALRRLARAKNPTDKAAALTAIASAAVSWKERL